MTALRLLVHASAWEAPDIRSYELRQPTGGVLPAFTAGAHVDLTLPSGLVRSYSLVNSQTERHRYVIAIQKDRASRGGSRWLHDNLRVGDLLNVAGPRNNFALDETAPHSVLIAGGIGITPIVSMIDRLEALDRSWELVYCARKRAGAAFLAVLDGKPRVRCNYDEEPGGRMLDILAVVAAAPADAHFYCCGPLQMLETFERVTRHLPRECVHVEYFSAKEAPAREGGFTLVLTKSGREVAVPAGKTILDALKDVGINVAHSCTEGICGTCETRVVEGTPDHRDLILTPEERAANKTMMVCCSGSKSERLVLEL
ncbi:MAG: oxidoreductase [Betaproteobacteria bacterium]|nr:oxidoreductase [Betaproteobacteria bacterium]